MNTITAVALMTMGLAAGAMAAEYKGFVEDEKCSTNPEMKGDAACAQKCIKGGSPAVLVTPEGKIYKISKKSCKTKKITKTNYRLYAGDNLNILPKDIISWLECFNG